MQLYLVSDVAAELGLSASGVRFLEREGRIAPDAYTVGGMRLFDAKTIARVKRERTRTSLIVRRRAT